MGEPLANELVECILDHLDSELDLDKDTLLNCALVARAWVPASQRGIFRKIVLHPYKVTYDHEPYEAFLNSLSRLRAVFDENPRLANHVRSLVLYNIQCKKEIHASVASIVRRLSKVDELSFTLVGWRFLSPSLREALTDLVKTPSFYMFRTDEICDLVSLSREAKTVRNLGVENRSAFSREHFSSTTLPRSIKLDHLFLKFQTLPLQSLTIPSSQSSTPFTMAEWLQEKSCPFELGCLQSLRIQHHWVDSQIASILQQVGASLGELELENLNFRTFRQPLNVVHLMYTPNLHTLKLVNLHQSDLYTPVPWIESLFEPLLNGNRRKLCLQCLVIKLNISGHNNAIETLQWDQWTAFDKLLRKKEFGLLEKVEITVTSQSRIIPDIVGNILNEKLPFLKRSGKLRVIIESNCDDKPPNSHSRWRPPASSHQRPSPSPPPDGRLPPPPFSCRRRTFWSAFSMTRKGKSPRKAVFLSLSGCCGALAEE